MKFIKEIFGVPSRTTCPSPCKAELGRLLLWIRVHFSCIKFGTHITTLLFLSHMSHSGDHDLLQLVFVRSHAGSIVTIFGVKHF